MNNTTLNYRGDNADKSTRDKSLFSDGQRIIITTNALSVNTKAAFSSCLFPNSRMNQQSKQHRGIDV
jgi:hypothetical protein